MIQSKITSLQLDRFIPHDRPALEDLAAFLVVQVIVGKDLRIGVFVCLEDPINATFHLSDSALKFDMGHSGSPMMSFPNQIHSILDGDKRPIMQDGK